MTQLQIYSSRNMMYGLRTLLSKDNPDYLTPEECSKLRLENDIATIDYVDALLYSLGYGWDVIVDF